MNRPAPVAIRTDAEFWYNLPANYDILDTCYRMFLWTGDRSYIEDPVFLNFYDRTITDYTIRRDLTPERIMKRKSDIQTPPFLRGDPTYEESSRDNLVGIDLLRHSMPRTGPMLRWRQSGGTSGRLSSLSRPPRR